MDGVRKRPRGTTKKLYKLKVSNNPYVMALRGTPYGSSIPRSLSTGSELKVIDLAGLNLALTTTGTVTLINGVATGTDINNRVGRKIIMKSLIFNVNNFPVATTANALQGIMLRHIIVYDTQPNSAGTVPAVTDILESATTLAPLNLNNRDRFRVIYDKRSQIGSFFINATPNLVGGSPQNVFWSKYRKLNHEVIFSGTGATVANISSGAMYILFIGDFNSVAQTDFYTRIRFTDA